MFNGCCTVLPIPYRVFNSGQAEQLVVRTYMVVFAYGDHLCMDTELFAGSAYKFLLAALKGGGLCVRARKILLHVCTQCLRYAYQWFR